MPFQGQSSFPDREYLEQLLSHLEDQGRQELSLEERLLSSSDSQLKWLGDYLNDSSLNWQRRKLPVDDLTLTGTSPKWNLVIIDECKRSPQRFRERLRSDSNTVLQFSAAGWDERPILVRAEHGKLRVLDGMHRVIAAIRDDRSSVMAWVGTPAGKSQSQIQPGFVYALCRGYRRGIITEPQLVDTLRVLCSFSNVRQLIRQRLWQESELRPLLAKALGEKYEPT